MLTDIHSRQHDSPRYYGFPLLQQRQIHARWPRHSVEVSTLPRI